MFHNLCVISEHVVSHSQQRRSPALPPQAEVVLQYENTMMSFGVKGKKIWFSLSSSHSLLVLDTYHWQQTIHNVHGHRNAPDHLKKEMYIDLH